MPIIAPSVTAYTEEDYHQQIKNVAMFAERLHIDLMDGVFTKRKNISPAAAWWPVGVKADFHLMYKTPFKAARIILEHKPHMIIVHSEADGSFEALSALCRKHDVMVGVVLLPKASPQTIIEALDDIDHVLIFSGDLGEFGGMVNFDSLKKIDVLRSHKPDLEIGWDGGINNQNISQLASAGVDVFNVGGFIQNNDEPERAYRVLDRIAQETGTT